MHGSRTVDLDQGHCRYSVFNCASRRMKISQRVAALRADYEKRSAKLKQAWALTKEALAA